MSLCIVYLASPREFRVRGELRLTMLQSSLTHTRRYFPDTDIYIFHEDYTEEDKAALPSVTEWIQVDFRGLESRRTPSLTAPYGYLMMCRFFSGVFQTYPQLQRYTHVMRLDDDSFFLPPGPVMTPQMFDYDYIYRSVFCEARDQQSLYTFTMSFLKRHLGPNVQLRLPRILAQLRSLGVLRDDKYTGLAPYNNFHIASLRLWTHPIVQEYFREIESVNGILGHGWLDANIHAMVIFVLAEVIPIRQVLWTSFGYRHNLHVVAPGGIEALINPSLSFFPKPFGSTPDPPHLRGEPGTAQQDASQSTPHTPDGIP